MGGPWTNYRTVSLRKLQKNGAILKGYVAGVQPFYEQIVQYLPDYSERATLPKGHLHES